MNKIFYLFAILLFVNTGFAQHKTLTLQYNDSSKVIDITGLQSMSMFICGASKVNYEGKDYNTVLIGNQCWLKENINVGTMVNVSSGLSNNGVIEKYCYNNDTTYCNTYGGLYTWDEAMQFTNVEGSKGICPEGWHIPTRADFLTLINFVNNNANALKREDQGTGLGQGTNTSGFSALLTGAKKYDASSFIYLNQYAMLYSSYSYPCYGSNCATILELIFDSPLVPTESAGFTRWGIGVRCIKNVN